MADLKKVYAAVDEEAALYELDNFAENGIQNILKLVCPSEITGLNYQPTSNIRSLSER